MCPPSYGGHIFVIVKEVALLLEVGAQNDRLISCLYPIPNKRNRVFVGTTYSYTGPIYIRPPGLLLALLLS